MRGLRFVVVAIFASCLLSVAARFFISDLDHEPGVPEVVVELLAWQISLSALIGTAVWTLALGIAWLDARQQARV